MESLFSPDNMNVFMSVIIAIYATTIIAPMLYFYVDFCMHRRTDAAAAGSNAHGVAAPLPTDGYELEKIRVDASSGEPGALPVLLCESSSSANADYCAVCLGEMEEGELGRMLPTCLHVFHIGALTRGSDAIRHARSAGWP
ncbi:RING-H2 finger protein ATL40-like [Brachypodium distachyon]|uniref:RING-type domain-containing protein n=1 Tax=Brachypodium distachyon TaxID=15368 RepID=I1HLG0_BRADI|nr:RING-H2 finger protein ATL40-like [Brachypodium distachyon]KQK07326.1 hypothetical protein BRADI_2g34570v3 [Brachypodium distachyon]|eukprot:XP_024314582.1 RING-H2 finger protein ATL40-like [Brachypodium distachyon]